MVTWLPKKAAHHKQLFLVISLLDCLHQYGHLLHQMHCCKEISSNKKVKVPLYKSICLV